MKANKASATAKVIAASTILLAADTPGRAVTPPPRAVQLSRSFLSGSLADGFLALSAANPLTRFAWRCIEKLTLPGIIEHYWYRKHWIEQRCRGALAEGYERVVVLGAGFDALGFRLAENFPHVDVIEIDHPATQAAKRHGLAADGTTGPANLQFVAHDLSVAPLPTALLDDGKATLFVIEGVLMYLPPADVGRLLDTLRRLPGPVRIVFSFMTKWPDGGSGFRPRSRLIERWLTVREEPFLWALPPDDMADFLAGRRIRLVEIALGRDLGVQPAGSRGPLDGENLVLCEAG